MSVLWSEVPRFDPARLCPKCRCDQSIIDYHAGAGGQSRMRINDKLCLHLEVEHLHRLCRACSYEWLERTADDGVSHSATNGGQRI
ncbi:MAG: hypothetical protein ACREJS_14120 [Candidatus Rokuibacteriota bacterium]